MFGKKKDISEKNEVRDEVKDEVKDEAKADELPPVSTMKLLSFATTSDWVIITVATLCSILNGVAQPLMSLIFSNVIGLFATFMQEYQIDPKMAGINLQNSVNWLCIQFVIIGGVTFFTAYGQLSLWMASGELQAVRIRHAYYKAILSQDMGWFDMNASGDISSRISGDVNLVQEGISEKVGNMIQYVSCFICGFCIAFSKGWKLTLVLLAVVPVLAACGAFIAKLIQSKASGGQSAYGKAGSVAEEVLGSIRTIYSFGGQQREVARYETKIAQARKDGYRKAIITGVGIGTILSILFFTYALGMWFGAKLIAEENYGPQDVLAVFFTVLIGAMSIGQAAPSLTALATAQGAAAKLFSVIERESLINPFTETEEMKSLQSSIGTFTGNIEFKDINFSYPSRPDVPILKGVNLIIEAGTTVALVGPSGSGKSTTVGLIERFYDPLEGQIFIDGVDIKKVGIRFLREHIGIVGQEPVLFATTIKQNILFGLRTDAEANGDQVKLQKRVEEACKVANIHEFIMTLPKNYDTFVGEKGASLSGGQKQRIAIARALIKNPQILLLDEATSALDTESEKLVQKALDNASKDRTTVVIAHRLSTIKNANKIVVFNHGKIEEQGTHDELVNDAHIYAGLVESQKVRTEETPKLISDEIVRAKTLSRSGQMTIVVDDDDTSDDDVGIIKAISRKDTLLEAKKLKEEKLAKEPLPMLRVLGMAKKWWHLVVLGLVGSLIDGAIMPIYSLILTNVSNAFLEIANPQTRQSGVTEANFWSLMFVVLGIISFFAITSRIGALELVGESITYDIRLNSFETLLKQEIAFFDDPMNGVGVLSAKLSTEAEQVQGLISKVLGPIFMAIATLSVGLGLAFSSGWKLTLVVLACVPVIAIANIIQMKVLTVLSRETKKSYEKVSAIASESIVNIRTVAGLTREEAFYADFVSRVEKAHRSAIMGSIKAAFGFSMSMGSPFLINALAFWYGTTLVVSMEYDFKQMFQVITAVIFTGIALGQASSQLTTFVKSKVAAIDLFELLDRKPSIDGSETYGERPATLVGNLELKNAHFSYPTRPDIPILQGIDLKVLAGKKVALVGASGSGKSTIIALAQRFYDLEKGSFEVEQTSINNWNVPYLRSGMALVGQEPVLFDLTIAENIAYGNPSATQENIQDAAKMANAHDFILELPDGYDTRVGERGGQLSGGQKQRVAIARAIVRNPKLLLLDEATSALDSNSEKIVQQALDKASEGRTTITIAHRLSTIQDADIIVVMKNGKVVETGTHDELLSKKAFYHSLVFQQQLTSTSV